MKEASGELNMTVVVVIAVASLAAFFYTIIWPLIKDNMNSNTKCSRAICECKASCRNTGYATCHVKGSSRNFRCPWKG